MSLTHVIQSFTRLSMYDLFEMAYMKGNADNLRSVLELDDLGFLKQKVLNKLYTEADYKSSIVNVLLTYLIQHTGISYIILIMNFIEFDRFSWLERRALYQSILPGLLRAYDSKPLDIYLHYLVWGTKLRILLGFPLDKADYYIFGNRYLLPSCPIHIHKMIDIAMLAQRYDVINEFYVRTLNLIPIRERSEAKHNLSAMMDEWVYHEDEFWKAVADIHYIYNKTRLIQRAWRRYADQKYKRWLVRICRNTHSKLAYIIYCNS